MENVYTALFTTERPKRLTAVQLSTQYIILKFCLYKVAWKLQNPDMFMANTKMFV